MGKYLELLKAQWRMGAEEGKQLKKRDSDRFRQLFRKKKKEDVTIKFYQTRREAEENRKEGQRVFREVGKGYYVR